MTSTTKTKLAFFSGWEMQPCFPVSALLPMIRGFGALCLPLTFSTTI